VNADNRDVDEAAVGPFAVFPKENALPGAKRQAPTPDRKTKFRAGQHRANMGRHVIRAFHAVGPGGITIRRQTAHEIFQVTPDVAIRIFGDQQ